MSASGFTEPFKTGRFLREVKPPRTLTAQTARLTGQTERLTAATAGRRFGQPRLHGAGLLLVRGSPFMQAFMRRPRPCMLTERLIHRQLQRKKCCRPFEHVTESHNSQLCDDTATPEPRFLIISLTADLNFIDGRTH
nr:unnamed protein product [Digitaria exilis]